MFAYPAERESETVSTHARRGIEDMFILRSVAFQLGRLLRYTREGEEGMGNYTWSKNASYRHEDAIEPLLLHAVPRPTTCLEVRIIVHNASKRTRELFCCVTNRQG